MYARDDPIGWKQSTQFKKAFSVDVDIEFVGVWYVLNFLLEYISIHPMLRDTVASVGLIPREMVRLIEPASHSRDPNLY